jgi:hypothetical protein
VVTLTKANGNILPSPYKVLTSKIEDTWKARTMIARVKHLCYPEKVCGARKAKYVSGTQFNNR